VTQQLVPKKAGGRALAIEVLVVTPAVRALIRDDKSHQIYSAMQAGNKHGMQTMNQSLFSNYMNSAITKEAMLNHSEDSGEIERMLMQFGSTKGGR
jgi:twitching motility protein PilT